MQGSTAHNRHNAAVMCSLQRQHSAGTAMCSQERWLATSAAAWRHTASHRRRTSHPAAGAAHLPPRLAGRPPYPACWTAGTAPPSPAAGAGGAWGDGRCQDGPSAAGSPGSALLRHWWGTATPTARPAPPTLLAPSSTQSRTASSRVPGLATHTMSRRYACLQPPGQALHAQQLVGHQSEGSCNQTHLAQRASRRGGSAHPAASCRDRPPSRLTHRRWQSPTAVRRPQACVGPRL